MATRNIRQIGDEILYKKAKPVTEMNDKIETLIDDMLDTMYDAQGVGLAAPQVGILKRVVTIDVSPEGDSPIVLINPEIIEKDGEQVGEEGCLSVLGKSGQVRRPNHVKIRAFDRHMKEFEMEGEGLLARAFCHELDHLDGKLYVDLVEGPLHDVNNYEDEE